MTLSESNEWADESYDNYNLHELKRSGLPITHEFLELVLNLVSIPTKDIKDDWLTKANCRGINPDVMFPNDSKGGEEAKLYCSSCQVRAECLATAIQNKENNGVWGGLNEYELNLLVKKIINK